MLLLLACSSSVSDSDDPLAGLTVVAEDPSDSPVAGISDEWMERFLLGDAGFELAFRESMGLGPAYIRSSCAACHLDDARGPGFVQKMVIVDDDGVTPSADQSALPYGHTVRPYVAGGASTPLLPPEDVADLLLTTRVGPAVFGRGYIEAIDGAAIEAQAAAQVEPLSGRINYVAWDFYRAADDRFSLISVGQEQLIGRFGLKARIPTLDGFAADAYQGDMSITTDLRPDELANPDGLTDDEVPGVDLDVDTVLEVADYLRLLAIPTRDLPDNNGAALFAEAGCAGCHTPSLPTRADYPIPQLAGIEAPIYSDLLLHDMGPDLADGLSDGAAASSEWRTAPLIGLRFFRSYLHDGRATTVEDAILAHSGEAEASTAAFNALPDADRAALLLWVEAL